jgi:hypothetical protein
MAGLGRMLGVNDRQMEIISKMDINYLGFLIASLILHWWNSRGNK